jgi:hypothetical protein
MAYLLCFHLLSISSVGCTIAIDAAERLPSRLSPAKKGNQKTPTLQNQTAFLLARFSSDSGSAPLSPWSQSLLLVGVDIIDYMSKRLKIM